MRKNKAKNRWISDKISTIMHEGKYPHDQAIAMAINMYENRKEDGGGINPTPNNSKYKNIYAVKEGSYNPKLGNTFQIMYRDPKDPKFNPATDIETVTNEYLPQIKQSQQYKDYMNRMSTGTPFTPTQLYGEYETPSFATQKKIADVKRNVRTEGNRQGLPAGDYTRVTYSDGTFDYLTPEGEDKLRKMPNYLNYISNNTKMQNGGWYDNHPPAFSLDFGKQKPNQPIPSTTYNPEPVQQSLQQPTEQTYTAPPQFFNPYSDVDISTGAQTLGRGIQSGNTWDIVAGGLKTTTNLARDIFGGMGQEKVKNEALKKYYEDQRAFNLRQTEQFQEGGQMSQGQIMQQMAEALQNGADPEQIVQQLIQMGFSEDQAVQMIQQVANQMQGQSPQEEQMEGSYSNQQEEGREQTPMMQLGGTYLETLKGKRIVDFKLNPKTGNYDVEFE